MQELRKEEVKKVGAGNGAFAATFANFPAGLLLGGLGGGSVGLLAGYYLAYYPCPPVTKASSSDSV